MIWYFAKWKPRFRYDPVIAKEMFHFGKYIFMGSLLLFLRNHLDNLLVGKLMGVSALGFYAIAFNLSTFLSQYVVGRMYMVLFPVFSKLQDDLETLRSAFFKSLKMVSLIALPFCTFLVIAGPLVMQTIYGEKWLPAVPVLQILAFAGLFRSFIGTMSPIILAKGQSRFNFLISIIQTLVFFALVVPAALYLGTEGVGVAVVIASILGCAISIVRTQRILRFSAKRFLVALKPAFLGSLLMIVVFHGAAVGRGWLWHVTSPISTLGFIFLTGLSCLAYFSFVFFLDQEIRLELRKFV